MPPKARGGGGGDAPPPPMPRHVQEAQAAWTTFRSAMSPDSARDGFCQLRLLARERPSGMALVGLAKAQLLIAVEAGTKGADEEQCERSLGLFAHRALELCVTAAVEHDSLVGLGYSTSLLHLLAGLEHGEKRDAARCRLLGAYPAERVQQLVDAFSEASSDLPPMGWDLAPPFKPQFRWPQDPDLAHGKVNAAWKVASQVLRVFQRAVDSEAGPASAPVDRWAEGHFVIQRGRQQGSRVSDRTEMLSLIERLACGGECWLGRVDAKGPRPLDPLLVLPERERAALRSWLAACRAQRVARQTQEEQRVQAGLAALDAVASEAGRHDQAQIARVVEDGGRELAIYLVQEQLVHQLGPGSGSRTGRNSAASAANAAIDALLQVASIPVGEFCALVGQAQAQASSSGQQPERAGSSGLLSDKARRQAELGVLLEGEARTPGRVQYSLPLQHSEVAQMAACGDAGMAAQLQPTPSPTLQFAMKLGSYEQCQESLLEAATTPGKMQETLRKMMAAEGGELAPVARLLRELGGVPHAKSPLCPGWLLWQGFTAPSCAAQLALLTGHPQDSQVFPPHLPWRTQPTPGHQELEPGAVTILHTVGAHTELLLGWWFHMSVAAEGLGFLYGNDGLVQREVLDRDYRESTQRQVKVEESLSPVMVGMKLIEAVMAGSQVQQRQAAAAAAAAAQAALRTSSSGSMRRIPPRVLASSRRTNDAPSSSSDAESEEDFLRDDEASDAAAAAAAAPAAAADAPGRSAATAADAPRRSAAIAAAAGGSGGAWARGARGEEAAVLLRLLQLEHAMQQDFGLATKMADQLALDHSAAQRVFAVLAGAVAAVQRPPHPFYALEECGQMALALLPHHLPLLQPGARAPTLKELADARHQVRVAAVDRILAALHHLHSCGRLYAPWMEAVHDFLYLASAQPHGTPSGQLDEEHVQATAWNALGTLPLLDVLNLLGVLCTCFAWAFSSPADLGQWYQEALTVADAGGELSLPPEPAAHVPGGGAGSPGGEAVVRLNWMGLARVVADAASVSPMLARQLSLIPGLQPGGNDALPGGLQPPQLAEPELCTFALAVCTASPKAARLVQSVRSRAARRAAAVGPDGVVAQGDSWEMHVRIEGLQDLNCWRSLLVAVLDRVHEAQRKVQEVQQLLGDAALACQQDSQGRAQLLAEQPALLQHLHLLCLAIPRNSAKALLLSEMLLELRRLFEGIYTRKRLQTRLEMQEALEYVGTILCTCFQKMAAQSASMDAADGAPTEWSEAMVQSLSAAAPAAAQLERGVMACGSLPDKLRFFNASHHASHVFAQASVAAEDMLGLLDLEDRRLVLMLAAADCTMRAQISDLRHQLCATAPLKSLIQCLLLDALPYKWSQKMRAAGAREEQGQQAQAAPTRAAQEQQQQQQEGPSNTAAAARERRTRGSRAGAAAAAEAPVETAEEAARRQREREEAEAALLEDEQEQDQKMQQEREKQEHKQRQKAEQRAAAKPAARKKAAEQAAAAARAEQEREEEERQRAQAARQQEEAARQQAAAQQQEEEEQQQDAPFQRPQRAEQARRLQEARPQQQQQQKELESQQQGRQRQARQQPAVEQGVGGEPAAGCSKAKAQPDGGKHADPLPMAAGGRQGPQTQAGGNVPGAPPAEGPAAGASSRKRRGKERGAGAAAAAAAGDVGSPRTCHDAGAGPEQAPSVQAAPPTPPTAAGLGQQQQTAAVPGWPQAAPAPRGMQPPARRPATGGITLRQRHTARAGPAEPLTADGEVDLSALCFKDVVPGAPSARHPSPPATPALAGGGPAGASPALEAAPAALLTARRAPSAGTPAAPLVAPAPPQDRPSSGASTGSACGRPGSAGGPVVERSQPLFVGWTDEWECSCGERHALPERCGRGARDPCSYGGKCQQPHLQWDLPTENPTQADQKAGLPLAKPFGKNAFRHDQAAGRPAKPASGSSGSPGAAATAAQPSPSSAWTHDKPRVVAEAEETRCEAPAGADGQGVPGTICQASPRHPCAAATAEATAVAQAAAAAARAAPTAGERARSGASPHAAPTAPGTWAAAAEAGGWEVPAPAGPPHASPDGNTTAAAATLPQMTQLAQLPRAGLAATAGAGPGAAGWGGHGVLGAPAWAALPAITAAAEQRQQQQMYVEQQPFQQQQGADDEGEDDLAALLGAMGISTADEAAAPPAQPLASAAPAVPQDVENWSAGAGGSGEDEDSAAAVGAGGIWPGLGQSKEDAELEAALKASLADAHTSHGARKQQQQQQQQQQVSSGDDGGWQFPDGSAAGLSGGELGFAGLRNKTGEYNCFVNVIIQCLWRCADFRRQVSGWDRAFCGANEVLGGLHALFRQMEQQEQQRLSAGESAGGTLPPVDPTALREALAALPGQHFRMGEMNDAAEVLLSIYEKAREVSAGLGRPDGIKTTCGLAVKEEVHCSACRKTTHQSSYEQYFYNAQATVLRYLHSDSPGSGMGQLLREAEARHRKSCDDDVGGCGKPNAVNHILERAPRVFTLQLAWESHSEQPEDIAGTLAALDEEVDMGDVYQGVERGAHRYCLRSMVCYYGQHYQALVLVPDAGGWLVFDDTRVTRVGGWADVRRKCEAGRTQPSVLFYEAA